MKRDPLALLDARTIAATDILTYEIRTFSGVTSNGEVLRGRAPERLREASMVLDAGAEAQRGHIHQVCGYDGRGGEWCCWGLCAWESKGRGDGEPGSEGEY